MKYIDIITSQGITQNLLAIDLVFENTSDATINLSGENLNNLAGMTKLSEAINFLDNLSDTGIGSGSSLTLYDEDGNIYNNIEKLIFDEVIITGNKEATVMLDSSLDRALNNINSNRAVYEGVPSKTHIFNHNLDTEFLKIDVWVQETVGWQNSIVPVTIIDNNSLKVLISKEKAVRIILEDISTITKTFGI